MTVYYLCFNDVQQPIGGVKVLYKHVDILNQNGIDAALVHRTPGFRCTWFDNETKVLHPDIPLAKGDVLALPEAMAPRLAEIAPGVAKVIINQNAFHTWNGVPALSDHPYKRGGDLLGVTCISEQNRALLKYAFPSLEVARLRVSLDPSVYGAAVSPSRARRIAYMPRKRAAESQQVLGMLHARGALRGWDVVPLTGMNQRQVAEELGKAALFLSFSEHEGCPLPPLEALASGCFVIGYTGFGAAEYFDEGFTTEVPDGDVVAFAQTVEAWLDAWDGDAELQRPFAASRHALDSYPPAREAEALLGFFQPVLARAASGASAVSVLTAGDLRMEPEAKPSLVKRTGRAVRAFQRSD